jgi:hypothetical protein
VQGFFNKAKMKVQYIKTHVSGRKDEIKEVSDDFGTYLVISGKAKELKTNRITKEDKTEYQTKEVKVKPIRKNVSN